MQIQINTDNDIERAPRIDCIDQVQTSDCAVDVLDARQEVTGPKRRAIERWEDEGGARLPIYSRQVGDAPHTASAGQT